MKKNIPDTLCSRRGVVIAIKLCEIEEQHDWKGFVTARGLHNGAKQFLKLHLNCNKIRGSHKGRVTGWPTHVSLCCPARLPSCETSLQSCAK